MANENYSFKKRQKELAKKKKNEEKRLSKLQKRNQPALTEGQAPNGEVTPQDPGPSSPL